MPLRPLFDSMLRAVRDSWQVSGSVAATIAILFVTAGWFPGTMASGLALVVLIMATGAAIAWSLAQLGRHSGRWPRSRGSGPVIATAILAAIGFAVFGPTWLPGTGWLNHDWAMHHALVRDLMDGLRQGHVPRWNHGLLTSAPPFEAQPSLIYHVIAAIAIVLDRHDVSLLLVRVAIAIHVLVALASMRMASRVAPWPLALLVGVVTLLERGTAASGGTAALFGQGDLPMATAELLVVLAFTALLDALRRPGLHVSLQIWLCFALAITAQTGALAAVLGAVLALLGVLFLARDVPRHRVIAALCHVAIAAGLAAVLWMPFTGPAMNLPGAAGPIAPWQFVSDMFTQPRSYTSFVPILFIAYMGLLAAIFSRRAGPTLIGLLAAFFIAGISDHLPALFELDASTRLARLPGVHLLSLARPALFVCAGYCAALVYQHVRLIWRGSSPWLLGAILALFAGLIVRGASPYLAQHVTRIIEDLHDRVPDMNGMRQLCEWARGEVAAMGPGRHGRLIADDDPGGERLYVAHILATTGMPVFTGDWRADLLASPDGVKEAEASLRRFNVRWAVSYNQSPRLGDPASEKTFGRWRVRTLASWDGNLAHVEQGTGEAVVSAIDDEQVVVDLDGTDQPALVALGVRYHPRWRARDATGRLLPVQAVPAAPGDTTPVVGVWLPPGRSVIALDGPLAFGVLSSLCAVLAFLAAVAIVAVWSRRRWRSVTLRLLARGSRRVRAWAAGPRLQGAARLAFATGLLAILAIALARSHRTMPALALGSQVTGEATVMARNPGEPWEDCPYSLLRGGHRCGYWLFIQDGQIDLPGHLFPPATVAPAVKVWRFHGPVEFRITVTRRLGGAYRAIGEGGPVRLTIGDGPAVQVDTTEEFAIAPEGDRTITIEGTLAGKTMFITFALVQVAAEMHTDDHEEPREPDRARSPISVP